MTNKEFVSAAKNIVVLNTAYASGTFGQKYTPSFIKQKANQYPKFYTDSVLKSLEKKSKEGTLYLFDCCGLIKGIIWGFPNPKYASNGMKDVNDQGVWDSYCIDKSSDFGMIFPGEVVHMKGHVGIYIGDGKVIEATNRWTKNVLVSSIIEGDKYYRKWEGHGKLNLLTYENMIIPAPPESDRTFYIVKPGDSLSKIAAANGIKDWRQLWAKNPNIINPHLIYPGQKIII